MLLQSINFRFRNCGNLAFISIESRETFSRFCRGAGGAKGIDKIARFALDFGGLDFST